MNINPSISLSKISKLINAEFIGDPDFIISGINEIHMVVAGDLTFVDHPKYYSKALNSNATTILINKKVEVPEGKAIIISEDPFSDFNALINHFQPFIPSTQMIDPTASIGEGTIIQPGAFVGPHVKIGKNCLIHANVSIYAYCELGDNVIIHSGSVIGADAFYFQRREGETIKFNSCGRVIIKDNVEIGACTTIDKGVTGDTVIGEYTKLDNHIQIGHDTILGKQCLIASHVAIAGVSEIKDNVIIWGQVGISKDLVIGENATILARSGVGKSLEGHKVYFGAPAMEARKKWREIARIRELTQDKE
ncbi:UDP-3-O-(3-hydroxymyristoyl)glucosamine N-acyltransferase [Bacteroidota bacterium]